MARKRDLSGLLEDPIYKDAIDKSLLDKYSIEPEEESADKKNPNDRRSYLPSDKELPTKGLEVYRELYDSILEDMDNSVSDKVEKEVSRAESLVGNSLKKLKYSSNIKGIGDQTPKDLAILTLLLMLGNSPDYKYVLLGGNVNEVAYVNQRGQVLLYFTGKMNVTYKNGTDGRRAEVSREFSAFIQSIRRSIQEME